MAGKVDTLHAAVKSLQQFFSEARTLSSGAAAKVKAEAERLRFPDPELAARVARLLKWKPSGAVKGFSVDEISDALLELLLDEESGVLQPGNMLVHWRAAVQRASRNFGRGLHAIFKAVQETGFGAHPTLVEAAEELAPAVERLRAMSPTRDAADRQRAAELVLKGELEAWKGALCIEWLASPWSDATPSAVELAALLRDEGALSRLRQVAGPWDVLVAQAGAHEAHRAVARGLHDLAEP